VAGRRHGGFLQLVSLRAVAMLADAGIRSAALKGPLLGEAVYGDSGRRPSSDVDLLVPPEQLRAAVEVLRGLGYGAPGDYVDGRGLPLLHFVPALARVVPAAAEAAGRIVGLSARWLLGDMPGPGLRGRMAVRMANPNPRSGSSRLYADAGLIDGLLAPRGARARS